MDSNDTLVICTVGNNVNNQNDVYKIGTTTLFGNSNIRNNIRETAEKFSTTINAEGYRKRDIIGAAVVGRRNARRHKTILTSRLRGHNISESLWRDDIRRVNGGTMDYFVKNNISEQIIDDYLRENGDINIIEYFQVCEECKQYVNIPCRFLDGEHHKLCENTEENDEEISDEDYVPNEQGVCGFRLHNNCVNRYLRRHPECNQNQNIDDDNWLCHKCV